MKNTMTTSLTIHEFELISREPAEELLRSPQQDHENHRESQ